VPQADKCTATKSGQFNGVNLPQAAVSQQLFDHLVGAGEQRRRHREAERLRGLEIDPQLELARLLDCQIAGLSRRANQAFAA
jgi:hypothetical protein